jgi:hypothetical protein
MMKNPSRNFLTRMMSTSRLRRRMKTKRMKTRRMKTKRMKTKTNQVNLPLFAVEC